MGKDSLGEDAGDSDLTLLLLLLALVLVVPLASEGSGAGDDAGELLVMISILPPVSMNSAVQSDS